MNFNRHNFDQLSKVLICTEIENKIYQKSKTIVDYPYVLLSDQHTLDLTAKGFFRIFIMTEEHEEFESKYYIKEHYYNISCNCETSNRAKILS
jgi:hypothetical protein